MLDALDRYKFGLLAAAMVYVVTFMYLQMKSYPSGAPYEPFHMGPYVQIPEDDIELQAENIQVPGNYSGDVKNISRDRNDDREQSNTDYSQNKMSASQMEQSVYDYEKQLFQESGGAAERAKIEQQMKDRQQQQKNQPTNNNNNNPINSGGNKAFSGAALVDFDVKGRTAYQSNNWYVRVPGYTCGKDASGVVFVNVKVSPNGNVVDAQYVAGKSANANSCMIEQGLKYAKMSRFSYASETSSGWIQYTFVPQ